MLSGAQDFKERQEWWHRKRELKVSPVLLALSQREQRSMTQRWGRLKQSSSRRAQVLLQTYRVAHRGIANSDSRLTHTEVMGERTKVGNGKHWHADRGYFYMVVNSVFWTTLTTRRDLRNWQRRTFKHNQVLVLKRRRPSVFGGKGIGLWSEDAFIQFLLS